MGSSRKLIKNKRSEEEEEDRISSLPSCLIGHILSFLPTKDVLKTSVLSTKWKYHWKSITNFYFDDQSVKSFINFVYRVLLLSVSDMHKFRLTCENICDNSHLSQWVSIATLRHVREVHISLLMNCHVMLPHELWTCNTLVVLKLADMLVLNVPTMVRLPSLKILHLDKMVFSDGDSTKRLVSSCPVLEDLAILECYWLDQNINVFNISADGWELLPELTYLELGVPDEGVTAGWELLPELLERAPKLETLVCKELLCYGGYNQLLRHTPTNVPYCVLFHLKVIEIRYFFWCSDELKIAEYFLKNAKVLERMVIRSAGGQQSKIICNTLLGLPRGSKTCRLEVY
ncbi:putative FBD-associated F-box protein At3g50710 [Cornus florida]|uniref:putative FBD-associated F-box protein At3g50710 n=1 Tax=Cornus florida TaxID=4283 RepID=UPI002897D60C|nr:putative FBD-associated F-box protein At3g50710 [Cornus florida]